MVLSACWVRALHPSPPTITIACAPLVNVLTVTAGCVGLGAFTKVGDGVCEYKKGGYTKGTDWDNYAMTTLAKCALGCLRNVKCTGCEYEVATKDCKCVCRPGGRRATIAHNVCWCVACGGEGVVDVGRRPLFLTGAFPSLLFRRRLLVLEQVLEHQRTGLDSIGKPTSRPNLHPRSHVLRFVHSMPVMRTWLHTSAQTSWRVPRSALIVISCAACMTRRMTRVVPNHLVRCLIVSTERRSRYETRRGLHCVGPVHKRVPTAKECTLAADALGIVHTQLAMTYKTEHPPGCYASAPDTYGVRVLSYNMGGSTQNTPLPGQLTICQRNPHSGCLCALPSICNTTQLLLCAHIPVHIGYDTDAPCFLAVAATCARSKSRPYDA